MRYSKTALLCCFLLSATVVDTVRGDDNPMNLLNRRVGTWVTRTYQKKAAWTPEERTSTGEETIKWVLDKKFLQGDAIHTDWGAKGHWLINYDAEARVYRSWFFGNQNEFPRGDTVGRWNAKGDRMDWTLDLGDGLRGKMTFQFTGNDRMEWTLTIKDTNGELMLDSGGTQTRKK